MTECLVDLCLPERVGAIRAVSGDVDRGDSSGMVIGDNFGFFYKLEKRSDS